jgi:hypothetical protein
MLYVERREKKQISLYCCQMRYVGVLGDCFELYHTEIRYLGNENYYTASI